MVQTMDALIQKYGTKMVLCHADQQHQIRAFLQGFKSKSQDNSHQQMAPLGEVNRGVYVYMGPVQPMAEAGDELVWEQRRFVLRRAEPVMVGNTAGYCWGLCVEKGGADTWGM